MMGKRDGYKLRSTYEFEAKQGKSVDKLSHNEMKLKNGKLFVGCGRCKNIEQIERFRIHWDNYVSFSFLCSKCNWTYSVYRGRYGEFKQVEKALLN